MKHTVESRAEAEPAAVQADARSSPSPQPPVVALEEEVCPTSEVAAEAPAQPLSVPESDSAPEGEALPEAAAEMAPEASPEMPFEDALESPSEISSEAVEELATETPLKAAAEDARTGGLEDLKTETVSESQSGIPMEDALEAAPEITSEASQEATASENVSPAGPEGDVKMTDDLAVDTAPETGSDHTSEPVPVLVSHPVAAPPPEAEPTEAVLEALPKETPEAASETAPDTTSEVDTAFPEITADAGPELVAEVAIEVAVPVVGSENEPVIRTETASEVVPEASPEIAELPALPETTSEATPDVTPEATPGPSADVVPETVVEMAPETSPGTETVSAAPESLAEVASGAAPELQTRVDETSSPEENEADQFAQIRPEENSEKQPDTVVQPTDEQPEEQEQADLPEAVSPTEVSSGPSTVVEAASDVKDSELDKEPTKEVEPEAPAVALPEAPSEVPCEVPSEARPEGGEEVQKGAEESVATRPSPAEGDTAQPAPPVAVAAVPAAVPAAAPRIEEAEDVPVQGKVPVLHAEAQEAPVPSKQAVVQPDAAQGSGTSGIKLEPSHDDLAENSAPSSSSTATPCPPSTEPAPCAAPAPSPAAKASVPVAESVILAPNQVPVKPDPKATAGRQPVLNSAPVRRNSVHQLDTYPSPFDDKQAALNLCSSASAASPVLNLSTASTAATATPPALGLNLSTTAASDAPLQLTMAARDEERPKIRLASKEKLFKPSVVALEETCKRMLPTGPTGPAQAAAQVSHVKPPTHKAAPVLSSNAKPPPPPPPVPQPQPQQQLPPWMAKFPPAALANIPAHVLSNMPPQLLQSIPPEVLLTMPPSFWADMGNLQGNLQSNLQGNLQGQASGKHSKGMVQPAPARPNKCDTSVRAKPLPPTQPQAQQSQQQPPLKSVLKSNQSSGQQAPPAEERRLFSTLPKDTVVIPTYYVEPGKKAPSAAPSAPASAAPMPMNLSSVHPAVAQQLAAPLKSASPGQPSQPPKPTAAAQAPLPPKPKVAPKPAQKAAPSKGLKVPTPPSGPSTSSGLLPPGLGSLPPGFDPAMLWGPMGPQFLPPQMLAQGLQGLQGYPMDPQQMAKMAMMPGLGPVPMGGTPLDPQKMAQFTQMAAMISMMPLDQQLGLAQGTPLDPQKMAQLNQMAAMMTMIPPDMMLNHAMMNSMRQNHMPGPAKSGQGSQSKQFKGQPPRSLPSSRTSSPAGQRDSGNARPGSRGSSPAQRGPSPAQRGPSPAQRGPSPAQRGPSPAQKSVAQTVPSPARHNPSPTSQHSMSPPPPAPSNIAASALSPLQRLAKQTSISITPAPANIKIPAPPSRPAPRAATSSASQQPLPPPPQHVPPPAPQQVSQQAQQAPPQGQPVKKQLGSKIRNVVDGLRAKAEQVGAPLNLADDQPTTPVKKVIQVTNTLTIELEQSGTEERRDRPARPPMPGLLPCKAIETPAAPAAPTPACQVFLLDQQTPAAKPTPTPRSPPKDDTAATCAQLMETLLVQVDELRHLQSSIKEQQPPLAAPGAAAPAPRRAKVKVTPTRAQMTGADGSLKRPPFARPLPPAKPVAPASTSATVAVPATAPAATVVASTSSPTPTSSVIAPVVSISPTVTISPSVSVTPIAPSGRRSSEDMSLPCSLPLNKVSQMLDSCRPGSSPAPVRPSIPPMLAAGGLEIVPMDIAATSMPARTFGIEKPHITAPSISLSPTVSLSLMGPRPSGPPVRRAPDTPDVSVTMETQPLAVPAATMTAPSAPTLHPKKELMAYGLHGLHGRAEQDAPGHSDNDDSQDALHADRLVIAEEEMASMLPKGEVDIEDMFEAKEEPLEHDAQFEAASPVVQDLDEEALDDAPEPSLLEQQATVPAPAAPPFVPAAPVPSPIPPPPADRQAELASTDLAPETGDSLNADDADGSERGADEYVVPVRSTRSGKPLEPTPTSPTAKASKPRKGKKDTSPGPKTGVGAKGETKKASKKKRESERKASKQPESESTEEGDQKYFTFNPSPDEFLVPGPDGQKWYYCDICEGLYKRAFSLKRHYLRSHINYAHLTVRDIANCGIAAGNKMPILQVDVASDDPSSAVEVSSEKSKDGIGGVYQCYTCDETFDEREEIRQHLSSHRKQLSDEALNDSEVGLAESQVVSDEAPTLEPAVTLEPSAIPDAAPILDPAPTALPIPENSTDKIANLTNEESITMENDLLSIALDESSSSNVEADVEKEVKEESFMCFFCDKFYGSRQKRHQHQLRIHLRPKRRKTKIIYACEYCENAEPIYRTLEDLFKHMCSSHKNVYFSCLSCELRFPDKKEYMEHQLLLHTEKEPSIENDVETLVTPAIPNEDPAPTSGATVEESDAKGAEEFQCTVCQKLLVSEQNLNRHYRLKHDNRGKKKKKRPDSLPVSDENLTEKLDPETLFYSQISTNIRENLLHHLDGKLDSQELYEREEEEPSLVPATDSSRTRISMDSVPGPSTSYSSQESLSEAMPATKLKHVNRRRSSDGSRTWEKYAFPKKYDGKGGMTSYLRDMSHVDIHTQVTMRQNARRLGSKEAVQSPTPSTSGGSTRSYNLRSSHEETPMLDFPSILSLTQSATGIQLRRTASAATLEKSMLSVSFNPPELPKSDHDKKLKPPKVPAADYLNAAWRQGPFPMVNGRAELSGEWVRPKNYLCAACDARFKNLYDLEDHKWNFHPNVWCTHFEFDDAALIPFTAVGIKSPSDLNRRAIDATGTIMSAPAVPSTQQCDMTCTKCQHISHTPADLHHHMLDCGGDATWQLMMVAASPGSSGNRRNKKWRPFGSRRRRPPGRRGLKRNIPNTPQRPRSNNPKTRGGDADTIQKMIANLPAKRATRRVIQFKEDEIKTRSQATIASTRLLRKRFKVPFPVSQSALHKASRALVDRSKTASSSKPGHMPKARPLRSQASSGPLSAPSTSTSADDPDPEEEATTEVEADVTMATEERRSPSESEKSASQEEPVTDAASSSVTTLKTITNSEPSGDRKNLRTNTILEAMKLAMLDSNPDSDDSVEEGNRKKCLRSEKLSMELQVQAMELEDEENALRQASVEPSSSVKEIHLPPAPSLELTTVQFLAKSMPPNFCAGCQRSFCNNSNRDRHLKVCPFLLQIAGDGMPKLRKQLEYRNHPLVLNSLSSNPPDFNLSMLPASDEKAKVQGSDSPDSRIADKLLFGETVPEKKPASGSKKAKDKKKQIVGIRKRTVPGDNSEGGVVIKESFLVRVDTSSLNDAVNNDTKEQEVSDTETPSNQLNKNRKPRKSDHVEKIVQKPSDTPNEDNPHDSKGKRRSVRSSTPAAEDDESRRKSVRCLSANANAVIDEDDLPLKKFTRARNASPAKIPVMRIDRATTGGSTEKQQSQTATSPMVSPRNSRQSTGKSHGSKRTASDVLDDDADYDTDEFEELLDKMAPDEIKNLDLLSQVLEGDESGSSDDDLPLVPKQKVNEEYSSDDDLPLKPKASSKVARVETNEAESSDEEIEQASTKRASRKKSSGTPIKKLQEIATSMAVSLSDLQSSMNKGKAKSKKVKPSEEELNDVATPPIKVIVKVTKPKDDEDDVSPSRRRSLRTKEVEKNQPEIQDLKGGKKKGKESELELEMEISASAKSSKKRAKVDSPEMESKEQADSQSRALSDETQSVKSSKKRIKLSADVGTLPEINQNLANHTQDSSEEIQRSSDMSKNKKKTKTPSIAPVPMPEPNPETVNELDPNLIGELTPRLSRKRFNELSTTPTTTPTPSTSSKLVIEPEPSSSLPVSKSVKSKSKSRPSETSGDTSGDAPITEATSKQTKSKSKSKKKAKGKSDEVEPTEDKDDNSEEKSPKINSKKFLELSDGDSKSSKRRMKSGSVLEESLEDGTATTNNQGKRIRLDDGAADSADNDSVITESDSSEVTKGKRSRSRLENSTDLSETESTSASIDMASTTSNSKQSVKKQGKRKSKGKPQLSNDIEEDNQNVNDATASPEVAQPSKRPKMDAVVDGSTQKETTSNSIEENDHGSLIEDVPQVPSETAAVPAANVGQNPPAAASPTPAEAPETNNKPKKTQKSSTYYCFVCQRHYSTAFNLHKHFASAYHKSNLNSYCSQDKTKTGDGTDGNFDLPDAVVAGGEEPKSQENNSQKVPPGSSCPTAEDESSSSEQTKEKTSDCEKLSEEREKMPEPEVLPTSSHDLTNANALPVSEMDQEPKSDVPVQDNSKERRGESLATSQSSQKADEPSVGATVVEAPAVEAPAVEAPAVEAPAVEAPSNEAPAVEAPRYTEMPQASQEQQTVGGASQYSQSQYNQQHYDQYNYNQGHHYQQHYGQPQQYDHQQPNPPYNHQEPQQTHPFDENSQPAMQTLQTFDHSQQPTQQTSHSYDSQVSNQHYNQQPSNQQHPQSYNNYNSSGNWQGTDSWGPWRIPDVIPSYSQEEASGGMGLGSILDSVNQVLSGDGGMSDSLPLYPDVTSLSDLQHAIGANDEEMAVLRQLGEGSLRELIGPHHQVAPAEEAELLDLDNQKKASDRSIAGPSSGSEGSAQASKAAPYLPSSRPGSSRSSQSSSSSGSGATTSTANAPPRSKGSLSTGPSLNELYEDKQMWCHLCHRRFLGLAAMKKHMESFHAHSGEGEPAGRKFERRSLALSAEGSSEPRLCCSVCKEMVTDEKALQQHNSEMHPPRSEQPKNKNSEGLRTQMSSALGGLLDRALKSYMSKSCAPNASNSETDKSRLTLGILSKLALRHQSSLSLPSGSGVSIGTIGGGGGPTTSMLVDQLVAAKLGMRRGSGGSMRRRSSGASSPGIDGSFGCPVCHERFAFEGSMKRHLMSHRRDPPEQPQEILSVCGINFKTPSEVMEHQRMEHVLNRRTSHEEEGDGAEEPHIDSETAEKAEKWIENHTKLQSSPKGRHPLGKDVKNRKVAIAVESALLERTEEMRIKAEAALRELNQTRKPAKGSSKEAKWGVDAVKFTVTKEPPLVGVFGPTLENEKKQINIPVVRKMPNNTPRFSFLGKKGGMFKGSDDAKSEKEKIDVYDFDEANKSSSSKQQNDEANSAANPGAEAPKKKKRAPRKETQAKKAAAAAAAAAAGEKGADGATEVAKPKPKPRVRKSTSKKAKAPNQTTAPTGAEGVPINPTQPTTQEPSLEQPHVATPAQAPAPAPVPAPLPRDPQPLPGEAVEGPPASLDAKEQSEVGKANRSPRAKASLKTGLSVLVQDNRQLHVPTRAPRRASMHDVTDYSVFDFSSDESTDEELLINPDAPSARSRSRSTQGPGTIPGSAPGTTAPGTTTPGATTTTPSPGHAPCPQRVKKPADARVRRLLEEDWTWLEEDSDEYEREARQQRSARRKRARRAAKSEAVRAHGGHGGHGAGSAPTFPVPDPKARQERERQERGVKCS
ncbi:uncharacterized protein LOC117653831 isoform X2 [Thrips palmi]|uniref:Uncharacterized protein LOC117653831 isoform X2 n=1 Tax=Thrips palmi TaxID=161013 RepID=A0A6P9ADU7_THRPL|nr:uncharacterized protein LOC117653831 isoform X2 [Thrips palmi]